MKALKRIGARTPTKTSSRPGELAGKTEEGCADRLQGLGI
jgi:hypothetical protein